MATVTPVVDKYDLSIFRTKLHLLIKVLWPEVLLYDKQIEILKSLVENDETYVPAGNMLGKDFITGLAVLCFFLTRTPCRIVTTSVDSTQLNAVLWGEIRRFIQSSVHALEDKNGGPLVVNHLFIRKKLIEKDDVCGLSYILGRVATDDGTGFLGHHIANIGDGIPRALFVADEASGVPNMYYDKAMTWFHRALIIGNTYPCTNFFRFAIKGRPGTNDKGGDIRRDSGVGYWRKIIKIRAQDSPNVRLAEMQIANGMQPTFQQIIPGVKDYALYLKNRKMMDPIAQCVSLDADFYEGAEVLLYPPNWLNHCERISSLRLFHLRNRQAEAIGVDTADGGDETVATAVDRYGIIEQISWKTPDTNKIIGWIIAFWTKWGCDPRNVIFDYGGGGKQHVDRLRAMGHMVRAVGFGEAATSIDKFKRNRGYRPEKYKIDESETKMVFKNRRAEMYWILRQLINPMNYIGSNGEIDPNDGFGIPANYVDLRRQLAPLPLLYDDEGVLYLPPKRKKNAQDTTITIMDILGCSPDKADSLVLATFGLMYQPVGFNVGAI